MIIDALRRFFKPRPIVPMGTVLDSGTVEGVQFKDGERYYFVIGEGGSVGYMPAALIEKQYEEQIKKEKP